MFRNITALRRASNVCFNGQIAIVKISNPPVNVLNRHVLEFLKDTFDSLKCKPDIDGIILTAERDGIFSAGLDLLEFSHGSEKDGREYWRMVQDMWLSLYMCPLPVIAAINGSSPAGGSVWHVITVSAAVILSTWLD